jgi:DHA2 family multidrug resistance protein-like MFS transporter
MSVVSTRQAGRREWIGLAVIALPCLLYSMDLTVLNLAVPHLSADLQPSSTHSCGSWTSTDSCSPGR